MYLRLLHKALFLVLFITMIPGCGGLRFSQVAPDIGDFHPEKICIFPVRASVYEEVANKADTLIADTVREQGYFVSVISPAKVTELAKSNDKLEKAITEYLAKLKKVHFSDPNISNYIGETCDVDAFLVVDVDFWNYTTQGDDKLAKVGFTMDLIEARTGKIVWNAKHYETKSYKWFEPDLVDFAEEVAEAMISRMPH